MTHKYEPLQALTSLLRTLISNYSKHECSAACNDTLYALAGTWAKALHCILNRTLIFFIMTNL